MKTQYVITIPEGLTAETIEIKQKILELQALIGKGTTITTGEHHVINRKQVAEDFVSATIERAEGDDLQRQVEEGDFFEWSPVLLDFALDEYEHVMYTDCMELFKQKMESK